MVKATEADYYRAMLRNPPRPAKAAAHLVWVRLMARVLMDVQTWAPCFAIALAASARSMNFMRAYCQSGAYERTVAAGLPHAIGFLQFFLGSRHQDWLKDVARCETWASALDGRVPPMFRHKLRKALGVSRRRNIEFVVVSHDVLETLQHLVGYADIGMIRVGGLLWLLQIDPVYPVIDPMRRAGVVVFTGTTNAVEMRFAALPPATQ